MNQKIILCLFSALLLPALPALGAEKDIINKSFNAKPGDTLYMKVDRGSIKVLTSNSDKVDIKVVRELRRASDSKAREIYDLHKIDFSQDGNTVRIEADNKQKGGTGWFKNAFNNPFNNLHVEYTISIPSRFDVDLRTSGGNIDIQDLEGVVKAHTSGGHLALGSIKGDINAHTSGGNIKVEGGTGNADVHTSGGNLTIGNIDGDLKARTSGGNITLAHIHGSIDAETSGGHIKVTEALGPINASTSGGNVTAELANQPSADCSLRTSGGNINVTLTEKVAVDLNARTSGGRVNSDFSGDYNKQRTRLVAKINGGGPGLTLETSGGNVDVRKK